MINQLSGTWLLDTNILVAFFDVDSPKNGIAKEILKQAGEGVFKGTVSSQNILELSAVLIAGYKGSRVKVSADLNKLLAFFGNSTIIYPNAKSMSQYLKLLSENHTVHMTDLFLAATMLSCGITSIITSDSVFEKILGVKVYNPFK